MAKVSLFWGSCGFPELSYGIIFLQNVKVETSDISLEYREDRGSPTACPPTKACL